MTLWVHLNGVPLASSVDIGQPWLDASPETILGDGKGVSMKIGLRRVALASTLVVAVAAAGAVPGAVASEPASARDGAVAVQELRDELAEAVGRG